MKLKLICFNSNRRLSAIVFSEASKVYCKMLSRFKALSTLNRNAIADCYEKLTIKKSIREYIDFQNS